MGNSYSCDILRRRLTGVIEMITAGRHLLHVDGQSFNLEAKVNLRHVGPWQFSLADCRTWRGSAADWPRLLVRERPSLPRLLDAYDKGPITGTPRSPSELYCRLTGSVSRSCRLHNIFPMRILRLPASFGANRPSTILSSVHET